MVYRRERPKIRKLLEELMSEYGWNAAELYEFTRYDNEDVDWSPIFCLSGGMHIQLRKIIEEGCNHEILSKTTLELFCRARKDDIDEETK